MFYSLLMAMGIGSCCFPVDDLQFFDEMPVELVIVIFSYLDGKSLSTMARTNKRLFKICKSNKQLRTTIRRHLRKERKEQLRQMLNPVKVTVLREETAGSSSNAFRAENANRRIVVKRQFGFTRESTDSSRVLPFINKQDRTVSKKRKIAPPEKCSELSKRIRI